MTGWIIAGIGIPILGWLSLHFIKKCTKLEAENASLKLSNSVKNKQLEIAARPADNPTDVLDRMFKDEGN